MGIITVEGEAGLPILQALTTSFQGWEAAWIPLFRAVFGIFDFFGQLVLAIWEFIVDTVFALLVALSPFLLPALRFISCAMASVTCALRELLVFPIQGLILIFNTFVGGFLAIFNGGQIPEIIPLSSA